jgi:CheY-like chemotaxis protein
MKQKTILVIEDNELNMKLVRGILSTTSYEMIEAVDAETGLLIVREHRPDLILMDIQLPGMDGLSATNVIKSEKSIDDIPVIALTSYAMQGDEEKALEAGCAGYITKPFDAKSLLKIIKEFLN